MADTEKSSHPHAKIGRATRERLLGIESKKDRRAADELVPELAALSDDANWGQIWSRPGLDLRTRSLCTICALLALERYKYAYGHIRGARRIGITREELAEAVTQLTFYAGLSVVHEGLALVARAFEDEPLR
ncbi:MAG: carboxymuconolactone decarboxylase family protein [Casimicrobiaceae bacterium]